MSKCKICNSKNLKKILNLTNQPPANSLHLNKVSQKKYPLLLLMCQDCRTVQISYAIAPKKLFSKYFWVTNTSKVAKKYANKFFVEVSKRINSKDKILEIASNDGTFLKPFKKKGHEVLGVDPAKNIVSIANTHQIKTLNEFFSFKVANKIKKKFQPNFIFARNVIPHVKNIHSIIRGFDSLANQETIIAIEFHYLKKIFDEMQYDSIYHEHLFYFSIQTLSNLFKKYNFYPYDVFESPISGGSLVLFFSKTKKNQSPRLKKLIYKEKNSKINYLKTWQLFSKKSLRHKVETRNIIQKYISKGANIVGYGASARSSTFLNFCRLNNKHIKTIFDKNKLKHELFTPGSNIKILSLKKINKKSSNVFLILAWNFQKEIISFLKKKVKSRSNFLVFFPKIKIYK